MILITLIKVSLGQAREPSHVQLSQQVSRVVPGVKQAQNWPERVTGFTSTVISGVCLTEIQAKRREKYMMQ